jgi:hypothetical protein
MRSIDVASEWAWKCVHYTTAQHVNGVAAVGGEVAFKYCLVAQSNHSASDAERPAVPAGGIAFKKALGKDSSAVEHVHSAAIAACLAADE